MIRLLSTLLGPMAAKEMIEITRRKRYYFNRVLLGGVILICLLMVWDEFRVYRLYRYSGASLIQRMAELADALFVTVGTIQYGAVFLFVPVFLCGVIASERENKSLELLLTTQLSEREIVIGKMGSRLVTAMFIIASGIPIMSLVMLFGGIDPWGLVRLMFATLTAMVFVGSVAIYFSSASRSPMGALVRTYWWLAIYLVAVPMALLIPALAITRGPPPIPLMGMFFLLNPLGAFLTAVIPAAHNSAMGTVGWWYFPAAMVFPMAASAFFVQRAVAQLRLQPTPLGYWVRRQFERLNLIRPKGEAVNPTRRSLRSRLAGNLVDAFPLPAAILKALLQGYRRARVRVPNPLWQRSRVARVYDRDNHIFRIQILGWVAACGFFILLAIFDPRELEHEEVAMTFIGFSWAGIGLLSMVIASTSLVGDRNRGFLDLVLATPMSAAQIINGTVLAVWEHLRIIFWLPVALSVVFSIIGEPNFIGAIVSLVTSALFGLVIIYFGVVCSVVARNISAALIFAFIFVVVTMVITAVMIGVFEEASGFLFWIVVAGGFTVTRMWVTARTNIAAVGLYLLFLHLFLGAVFSCWTIAYFDRREEYPIAAMHPGFLSLVMLDDHPELDRHGHPPWFLVYPCYWSALLLTIHFTKTWAIHNFDRLAGRANGGRKMSWPLEEKLLEKFQVATGPIRRKIEARSGYDSPPSRSP